MLQNKGLKFFLDALVLVVLRSFGGASVYCKVRKASIYNVGLVHNFY